MQNEANHPTLSDSASLYSNISSMAPQKPLYTLLPKCIYEGRGRGGGSRCVDRVVHVQSRLLLELQVMV